MKRLNKDTKSTPSIPLQTTQRWKSKLNYFSMEHRIEVVFILSLNNKYVNISLNNDSSSLLFYKNRKLKLKQQIISKYLQSNTVGDLVRNSFVKVSKSAVVNLKPARIDVQKVLFWPDGEPYGVFCALNVKKENELNIRKQAMKILNEISEDLAEIYHSQAENKPHEEDTYNVIPEKYLADSCIYCNQLILIVDLEGKILSTNQHFLSHLGYKNSQICGIKVKTIIPDEHYQSFKDYTDKALNQEISHFRSSIIDGEGKIIAVRIVVEMLYINNLIVKAYIIKDISMQTKINQAIRRSEKILKDQNLNGSISNWVWHVGTDKVYVSEEGKNIFGLNDVEGYLPLQVLAKCIHPDDINKINVSIKKSLKTKLPQYLEFRIIRADGGERVVQSRREAIVDYSGQVTRLVSTLQDITRQKSFEKVLNDCEFEYRNFFEAISEGFFFITYTDKNIITYASPGAEVLLGRPLSELIGSDWQKSVNWVSKSKADDKSLAVPNYFSNVLEYIHPNGSRRALLCSYVVIKDYEENPANYQGFAQDITALKVFEEKLLAAKEAAEENNRSKSDILANISHEIKTPMNAIIGIVHLLTESNLTYQQRQYVDKLEVAANWLLDIINNILDFSKIEAKKVSIEKVEFSLRSTIARVIALFEQRVGEKKLKLYTKIEDNVPDLIIGDSIRTMQIINNFISNAIKFTDFGSIALTISVYEQQLDTVVLKISVQDTGIGIPEDKQDKLFQAFTQADESTTRKYGGTGLGLTICKQLTELMDGNIWFSSVVNFGSVFNVTLPYIISENDKQQNDLLSLSADNTKALIMGDKSFNMNIKAVLKEIIPQIDSLPPSIAGLDLIKILQGNEYDILVIDLYNNNLSVTKLFDFIVKSGVLNIPTLLVMPPDFNCKLLHEIKKVDKIKILNKPLNTKKLIKAAIRVLDNKFSDIDIARGNIHDLINKSVEYRVLLVEDLKLNQLIVKELLKKCNIEVYIANNGAEALQLFQENNFNLILMDIEMPIMDGFMLTSEIRKLESSAADSVPIIALSAHSIHTERAKGYLAGMNDYITKPIHPSTFYAVVNKWLKSNHSIINTNANESTVELWLKELQLLNLFEFNEILEVVDSSTRLYKNLLVYFLSYIKELKGKMLVELYHKDKQSVKLTIHDLKGIAGTIGAMKLYNECLKLEKSIEIKWPDLIIELAGFCILINEYIKVLDQLLNKVDSKMN